MRFFPRNRKSRHDALTGLSGQIASHPIPDSLTRRDRLKRYVRGNGGVLALGGALASADQATFRAGGTLTVTLSGDDIFLGSGITALATQLIAAFVLLTGVTLDSSAFALNGPRTVLTVTIPVSNTAATGSYALSFAKTLFRNANAALAATLVIS